MISVTTRLVADDGTSLPPLVTSGPERRAEWLDPTSRPVLSTLATIAAARGEDLIVEGPADEESVAQATRVAAFLAARWGTSTAVRVDDVRAAPEGGDDVGLLFTRGADSWSTLLDLLDAGPPDRVTRLVWVHSSLQPEIQRQERVVAASIAPIAADLGLECAVVGTTARALLDHRQEWIHTHTPVLAGAALTFGATLRRLVISGSYPAAQPTNAADTPELIEMLGTGATTTVFGNPDRQRHERISHLARHPLARSTLLVCWEQGIERNCGRCRKCLLTMTALALADDPDPAAGFEAPLDPDVVRTIDVPASLGPLVAPLVRAGSDRPGRGRAWWRRRRRDAMVRELALAWDDAWKRSNPGHDGLLDL